MSDLAARIGVLILLGILTWLGAARLRRYFSSGRLPSRIDPLDIRVDGSGALIEFTSPYCHECRVALPDLAAASEAHGATFNVIDARRRPDLAHKYGIRTTPTVLVVDRRGSVRAGWVGGIPERADLDLALSRVAS